MYWWGGRPRRWPGAGGAAVAVAVADGDADAVPVPVPVAVPVVLVTVWTAVLKVAATAAPLPSRVTVTGLVRPKFWQPRLVKDMLSLFAKKVSRLLPVPGTGVWPVASSAWLACRNGVWMLIMFWQYIAGLLVLLFAALTAG